MSFKDKHGNWYNDVCGYLEVVDVLSKLEYPVQSDVIVIATNDNGRTNQIFIPEDELQDEISVKKHLARGKFTVAKQYYQYIENLIKHQIRLVRKNNDTKFVHESLGWFTHNDEKIFLMEGTSANSSIISTSTYTHTEFQGGCKEKYEQFLQNYIFTDAELTLAFILGHTSVLASHLKNICSIGTIVINIAGTSSTGKSTIEYLMVSPFMKPSIGESKIMPRINSTENALIQSLSNIHGLPIIIDDTTANDQLNIKNFIYTLSGGTSKARCDSNGAVKSTPPSWSGLIALSSESPILDVEKGIDGRCVRTICFNNIPWTKDAETANIIKETTITNYGHTGGDYANFILKHDINNLKDEFKHCQAEILKQLSKKDSFTERISINLAAISLTANYVQKYYNIPQSIVNKAAQILIKNEIKSTKERDIIRAAYDAFNGFSMANSTYFNRDYLYCVGEIHVEHHIKRIYIYAKDMDTVFEKCQMSKDNKRMIFAKLKEKGLLVCDKNRTDTKYIGVRAYCILYPLFYSDVDDFYNSPQPTIEANSAFSVYNVRPAALSTTAERQCSENQKQEEQNE